MLIKLIRGRLVEATRVHGNSVLRQFSFEAKKSTVDVVMLVVDVVQQVEAYSCGSRLLATPDVRNTQNSV